MEASEADRARAWRLMFITMTHVLNSVETDLKATDELTVIDIGCLFAVNSAGAVGVSMGTLAALYAVDPSVITYRIKRLEARGAVIREINTDNRRYTHVLITEDGKRLLRRARGHMLASADEHFFQHLPPDAPATFLLLLEPLLAAQQRDRPAVADPTRRCSPQAAARPARRAGRRNDRV